MNKLLYETVNDGSYDEDPTDYAERRAKYKKDRAIQHQNNAVERIIVQYDDNDIPKPVKEAFDEFKETVGHAAPIPNTAMFFWELGWNENGKQNREAILKLLENMSKIVESHFKLTSAKELLTKWLTDSFDCIYPPEDDIHGIDEQKVNDYEVLKEKAA